MLALIHVTVLIDIPIELTPMIGPAQVKATKNDGLVVAQIDFRRI